MTGQTMDPPRDGYFAGDAQAWPLGPTQFSHYHLGDECEEPVAPADDATRYRVARALAGSISRVETYAGDDDPGTALPYSVEEFRYLVRDVQPASPYGPAAVVLPRLLEKISYQYERFIHDPLCRHEIVLNTHLYGQSTHAITVSYARRQSATDSPPFTDPDEQQWWRDAHDQAQQCYYLNESRDRFIDLDNDLQQWRLGLPWQHRSNALVLPKGVLPSGLNPQEVSWESLKKHHDSTQWNALKELTGQTVQRYLNSADGSPLPEGSADFVALAAPLELAQLDKTALDAYSDLPPPFDIRTELQSIGYTPMAFLFEPSSAPDAQANLWSACYGYAKYDGPEAFFKVREYRETVSHGWTKAQYDNYWLLINSVELPDCCKTRSEYDYHALQSARLIDANDNYQEAIYEPSGQPFAVSFFGTENAVAAGFRPLDEYVRPEDHRPDAAIADPMAAVQKAASILRKDLFSWMGQLPIAANETPALLDEWITNGDVLPSLHVRASARRRLMRLESPTASESVLREMIEAVERKPVHSVVISADRYPDDPVTAQFPIVINYVDGYGRALQTQQKVEPGMAYVVDDDGSLIVDDGQLREEHADPRWRISARVEYNNKGLPVRQYRPFFADTHGYVNDLSLREHSYYEQLFYDALGRPIKLINAKGHFSRETYHPWYQTSEDFNDTDESEDSATAKARTLH